VLEAPPIGLPQASHGLDKSSIKPAFDNVKQAYSKLFFEYRKETIVTLAWQFDFFRGDKHLKSFWNTFFEFCVNYKMPLARG